MFRIKKALLAVPGTALGLALLSTAALGQTTMTIGNASGPPGGTAMVDLDFTGDGVQQSVTADLFYNSSVLTPRQSSPPVPDGCLNNLPPDIGGSFTSCQVTSPGQIRIILTGDPIGTVLPNAPMFGDITFDIAGGAPIGMEPLDLMSFDTTPGDDTDLVVTDGSVTVQAPAGAGFYASTPDPGGTVDLGEADVGNTTAPPEMLNVQNPSPDTDFDITGFSGPSVLNFPATPITVPFGDNVDVNITCSPSADGDNGGTFEVQHDAANGASSPVTYNFDCTGRAPNVTVNPTSFTLNGVVGQPAPSMDFDVSNMDDGTTSDANNAMLAEANGADPITFTPASFSGGTVTVGETETITVECDTTTDGTFMDTITVSWDDPTVMGGTDSADVTVNCEIINELPEYESDPAVGSTLPFGTLDNGTTSAPMGIDIGNSNTDAIPNAQLDITGATITGADPGAFQLATDPTGTMIPPDEGPDGTVDAEVTCTPTDSMSTFNATLEVESNDNDGSAGTTASPHTYPLTCSGQPDAEFVGNPPAGSTIDFGVLPQGSSSGIETIVVDNGGSLDNLDLDCSYTGDPEIQILSPMFPVSIAPGDPQTIESQCNATIPGTFSGTLDCTTNDPAAPTVSYDFTCTGAAIDVPTMSRWGLIGLGLTLLIGGALAVRLRA